MRNYEPNLIDSGEDWVVCKSEVVSNESEEMKVQLGRAYRLFKNCLLYTSPSPRDS